MPKKLNEVTFKAVEGNIEEAIPQLYKDYDIASGIDAKADHILIQKDVQGNISYRIPEAAQGMQPVLVPRMPEAGMLADLPKDYVQEYDVEYRPVNDKTRRFFLFPRGGDEKEANVKPYVVEVREDGRVYISEDTVDDYVSALNTEYILSSKERPQNSAHQPVLSNPQEDIPKETVNFKEADNKNIIGSLFSEDSIIRVNERFGKVLYDRNSQNEQEGAKTGPLKAAMSGLDSFPNSIYITVIGKDGKEEVHLAQKHRDQYYIYDKPFTEIAEDHNIDIDEYDDGYREITEYQLPEKKAAVESLIRGFDNAVCYSQDGKQLSEEEKNTALITEGRRFVVMPPDGSRPHWIVNKDGKLYTKPVSEKVAFSDEDFAELGAVNDPATAEKLKLPEGAWARDGQGSVYKNSALKAEMKRLEEAWAKEENGSVLNNSALVQEKDLSERLIDYLSPTTYKDPETGKETTIQRGNRLIVYEKPGDKPYLLENKNGVIRKSKPLDFGFDFDEEGLEPLETKYKLSQEFDFDDIAFAVDKDGKVFEGLDAIAAEMDKEDKMLFLFNKKYDAPYAVRNKEGKIQVSDQPVSSQSQLPDSDFDPKASLDAKDILTIPSKHDYIVKKDIWEDLASWDTKKAPLETFINKERSRIEKLEKAEPAIPNRPSAPRFGAGSKLWRGIVKVFSLGFGETAAYKKFVADTKTYNEVTIPEFEKEREKAQQAHDKWSKRIEGYRDNIAFYNKKKEQQKTLLPTLRANMETAYGKWMSQVSKSGEAQLISYRNHTEVFLEGVSDLMKNGLNRNNLSAYASMSYAACDGKPFSDADARLNLNAYVCAQLADSKITYDTVNDSNPNNADHDLMVEQINNGLAMKQLADDPDYQKIVNKSVEEHKGKIDAYDIKKKYEELILGRENKRDLKAQHDLAIKRLKDNRQYVVDSFGKRPLTKDCLNDIARLYGYDREIRLKAPNARYDTQGAKDAIKNLNSDHPEEADSVKDTHLFDKKKEPEKIIEKMMANEKESFRKMEEISKSLKGKQKQDFDNIRKSRYQTTTEELSADDPKYDPKNPKLIVRNPLGEETVSIEPNDPRLKDGTFEPGKSYVVTTKPVYTLEEMKEMYVGFQKELAPQAPQAGGPQA